MPAHFKDFNMSLGTLYCSVITAAGIYCPGELVLVLAMLSNLKLCIAECETMDGDTCVFPFSYHGIEHYVCITHDTGGIPWCEIAYGLTGTCKSDCPGKLVLTIQCDYGRKN